MNPRPLLAAAIAASAMLLIAARTRTVRPPSPPTFSKEVVRIFQQQCQTCHHPGDIAPFSLMTYEDARPWAAQIKHMTSTRQMPPWKADGSCNRYVGERRLSDHEIATIARWADAGAPEGDRADLPEPLHFDDGWALGTPDLTLALLSPFTPPAGADTYRCFPIPTSFAEVRAVKALDTHPGDRSTVHHVIAFLDTTGESERLDAADPEPGYPCFGGPGFATTSALGGWAPGMRPYELPDGIALQLPAQARVVLQVHYHPHHGSPQPDQTEIALYFAEAPVEKWLRILPLANTTFTIPAGASDHVVTTSFIVPPLASAQAWSVTPHMHLLGKSMKVEALRPDGTSACLVDVPEWDFNWQTTYVFRHPVPLPVGTIVTLRASFDNSAANPRNPNTPPKDVRWGEATTDEMCLAFIGVTLDAENLASGVEATRLPF